MIAQRGLWSGARAPSPPGRVPGHDNDDDDNSDNNE